MEGLIPRIGTVLGAAVVVFVAMFLWWFVLAWLVIKRPLLGVPVALFVILVVLVGWHDALAVAIYMLVALWIWRRAHRASFDRIAAQRVRNGWVRWWVYERRWRWRSTMRHCELGKRGWLGEAVPKIKTVTWTPWCDRVLVRLLVGQCTEDFERAAPELGHSFGARSCRVREHGPGRVWLEFTTNDPLVKTVPALPVSEQVDLEAVPIGLQEDGEPWRVKVLGTHLLVAGATGAGKSSVVWSLLRGLGPEIRDGRVAVWAVDPKGGMELGPGEPLYARFAVPTLDEHPYEAIAALLEDAVRAMQHRAQDLADGKLRTHTPTVEEPLILVVVDEIANLTASLTDRKLRDRIANALGLLLTQGRAVGVCVVAALQDPRKEVLAFRNLFPAKVALRLDEPVQIDMVLGQGAREQGARCDRIGDALHGVGYVRIDGVREPTRVRAAYVTNEDIAAMIFDYAAPRPPLDGEQLFRAGERDVDNEIVELPGASDADQPEDEDKRQAS